MPLEYHKTVLLASLPPPEQAAVAYPLQLIFSSDGREAGLYYRGSPLQMTRLVRSGELVTNSGTKLHHEELHEKTYVPGSYLRELLQRLDEGYRFQFTSDQVREIWQGLMEAQASGAVYNTTVSLRWHITLTVDLNSSTWLYESYDYADTST